MNVSYIIVFWLVIQFFGLLGLPFTFTLFRNLPDRGYVFARPFGLLLTGYVLWLAGSLGLLRNNLGGTVLAMGIVAGLGISWYRKQGGPRLTGWLKANRVYVISVEVIFTLSYVGWAIYKAYNPAIETAGGEKWMEIAFINANLLSPNFPPHDPWLSGFGISYYYFGYVFIAMLIRLSGVVSTSAFNLLIPMLLGLTLTGAYGVVANLVAVHQDSPISIPAARLTGLLGALFVGLLGHWEGLLEVLHSRGLLPVAFWRWLDIMNLKDAPTPGNWIPDRFIWWWRGSRVLNDYSLSGHQYELIDEIPIFSFLLGDVHPHVVSLPFSLLGIALAFNLLRQPKAGATPTTSLGWSSLGRLRQAMGGYPGLGLYALSFGAFFFLNFWNFPIALLVLGMAYLIWLGRPALLETILSMGLFSLFSAILYLPFHIGFQSQAGGILPNLWNPTRLPQFVVFFGPFLVASLGFLVILSRRATWPWRQNLRWSLGLTLLGPLVALGLLVGAFVASASGQAYLQALLNDPAVQTTINGDTIAALIRTSVLIRLGNPWTALLLAVLVGLSLAHFWTTTDEEGATQPLGMAERFGLILLIVGFLFPLSVEFAFLRDHFNNRMNTVFKFYVQAWVLLGLVSAFGVYYVSRSLEGMRRMVWQGVMTVSVLAGLVYSILAPLDKAGYFNREPTLDGIAWVAERFPDDHAAILWLRENAPPDAVILEAPADGADAYKYEGRISALTGRPALLGWGGHENQWRGSFDEPARRHPDIETLYNGLDLQKTLTLLDKYDITYVYVGPIERQKYRPNGLAKFEQLLNVVFRQGDVVIYQRSEAQELVAGG